MSILQSAIDACISDIEIAKADLSLSYSRRALNGIYTDSIENSIVKLQVLLDQFREYDITDSVNYPDSYFYCLKNESKKYCGNINLTIPSEESNEVFASESHIRVIHTLTTGGSGSSIDSDYVLSSRRNYFYVNINLIGYNVLTLGDGVKTSECYFTNDNGTTARPLDELEALDKLYINADVIGAAITTSDNIEITII